MRKSIILLLFFYVALMLLAKCSSLSLSLSLSPLSSDPIPKENLSQTPFVPSVAFDSFESSTRPPCEQHTPTSHAHTRPYTDTHTIRPPLFYFAANMHPARTKKTATPNPNPKPQPPLHPRITVERRRINTWQLLPQKPRTTHSYVVSTPLIHAFSPAPLV